MIKAAVSGHNGSQNEVNLLLPFSSLRRVGLQRLRVLLAPNRRRALGL